MGSVAGSNAAHSRIPGVAVQVGLFAAYWAVSHLAWLASGHYGVLPVAIWPAAGLALAAALFLGWRATPALFLGAVAAGWLSIGVPLPVTLAIGVMNALAPTVCALWLRARCGPPACMFRDVRHLLRFLLVGVGLQAILSASAGIVALWSGGLLADTELGSRWLRWWLAQASGTMLFAPPILLWAEGSAPTAREGWWAELAAVAGIGLLLTALAYFGAAGKAEALLGFPLVLSLPVLWIAVRFSPREVATYVLPAGAIVVAAALVHQGDVMAAGDPRPLITAGVIVIAYMLIGLVLAALVEERRLGEERLSEAHRVAEEINRSLLASLAEGKRLQRTQGQLTEIIDAAHDLVACADPDGRITYMNAAGRALLGISPDEDIGSRRITEFHVPEVARRILEVAIPRSLADGHWEGETEFLAHGGRVIPMSQVIVAHLGTDGRPFQYSTIARDIRQRRKTEEELWLAANVFQSAAEGITVTDADGVILAVNPAFTEISGYTAAEAIGRRPSVMKSDHHDRSFYEAMWTTLLETGHWQGEVWNRRKDGAVFLAAQNITMVPDAAGKPARYVAVFSDITETRRREEHIRHLAFHDALTDLPNRSLFVDRLERAAAKAARQEGVFAVMFLDLDRFKNINDSLGHDVGDKLLREVALRLAGCVRAMDTVARLGGDEFVVLVDELAASDDAVPVAEKIVAALVEPVEVDGHSLHVTTSIGIALFPQDGADAATLMKSADTALYAAKAAGRNQYGFFSPAMNETAHRRLQLENDLRAAVRLSQFELHYQPKICLRTGSPCGVEALVRWRHPEHGLVPPDEFIGLAEETGLILDVGDWVIDEACRQAAAWQAQGLPPFAIAINVSARQLRDAFLATTVAVAAEHYGIEPSLLQIEITESALMEDPAGVAEVLEPLRQLGITVAVDDFGTGYSSLAYLRRLPIDVLKVDRSFVRDADQDEEDAAIVRTVVALAHTLRLSVVAEGVETEAQAALLKRLKCEFAQGYLYAKPMPAAALERWLAERGTAAFACGMSAA